MKVLTRSSMALTSTLAVALLACSSGSNGDKLRIGKEGDDPETGGSAGFEGSSPGQVGDGGVATGNGALSVRVQDVDEMTLEVITLACAGDCADVEAVARGGNPPYRFAWEDGSKSATRRVCLGASKTLSIDVIDTAIDSEEFQYDAQKATAAVSAIVLDCAAPSATDGGSAECIANPSFEGPVTPNQLTAFDAKPWNACYDGAFITYSAIGNSTLWPTQSWTFPDPSDGETYLALGLQGALTGRAAQTLCEPLRAGQSLSFRVDLAVAKSDSPNVEATTQSIVVLGGATECDETAVLWKSPALTSGWTTHCVTLTPSTDVTTLAFIPAASGGGGEMEGLVDNIVPVESCP